MFAKLTFLVKVAALLGVTAAPAANHTLVARDCPGERPYVTLKGDRLVRIESLDKNDHDKYSDSAPFERKFAFYEPDHYEMEHFKLITLKLELGMAGAPTHDAVDNKVYDCRISAVGGVPDIYRPAEIIVKDDGTISPGVGSVIAECVPWGMTFKTIPGHQGSV